MEGGARNVSAHLFDHPSRHAVHNLYGTADHLIPTYGAPGFPDMGWISAGTYTGIQKAVGRDCIVFQKDDMTAWVDEDTRYPVKWQRGGEIRTFAQLPPPAAPLVLPPEVTKLSEAIKREKEILMRPIPRGG